MLSIEQFALPKGARVFDRWPPRAVQGGGGVHAVPQPLPRREATGARPPLVALRALARSRLGASALARLLRARSSECARARARARDVMWREWGSSGLRSRPA